MSAAKTIKINFLPAPSTDRATTKVNIELYAKRQRKVLLPVLRPTRSLPLLLRNRLPWTDMSIRDSYCQVQGVDLLAVLHPAQHPPLQSPLMQLVYSYCLFPVPGCEALVPASSPNHELPGSVAINLHGN